MALTDDEKKKKELEFKENLEFITQLERKTELERRLKTKEQPLSIRSTQPAQKAAIPLRPLPPVDGQEETEDKTTQNQSDYLKQQEQSLSQSQLNRPQERTKEDWDQIQNQDRERKQEVEDVLPEQPAQQQPSTNQKPQQPFFKEQLKDQVKQQVKKQVQRGLARLAISTSPYWGTALLIILGIGVVLGVVIITPVVICNGDWTSSSTQFVAKTALTTSGICSQLKMNDAVTHPPSGGAGATGEWDGAISIVLTSAYRPGAVTTGGNLSAHGRGEAFDVALRNPSLSFGSTDPRINQVISFAQSMGFVGARGDVLNEYANPQCDRNSASCGGHIHVEFNNGYCSGSPSANPPNDLVSIPSSIPMSNVSGPQVRQCMLPYLTRMFEWAAQGPSTPSQ